MQHDWCPYKKGKFEDRHTLRENTMRSNPGRSNPVWEREGELHRGTTVNFHLEGWVEVCLSNMESTDMGSWVKHEESRGDFLEEEVWAEIWRKEDGMEPHGERSIVQVPYHSQGDMWEMNLEVLTEVRTWKVLLAILRSLDFILLTVNNIYIFLNKFIYLFLAALGLRCCARAFSSCGEQGLLFVGVRGFLIMVASLVAEHGL